MKTLLMTLVMLLGLVFAGCSTQGTVGAAAENGRPSALADDDDDDQDDDDDEEEISLDQVPKAAKDAALAKVPGLVLREAEREVENGVTIYSLEGRANGREYEVEVTADGKVVEVEDGDEDDDVGEDDR